MRALSTTTAVVVAALALSAHAPVNGGVTGPDVVAASEPSQCFNVRQVRGFSHGSRDQVFLRVGSRDVYELSTGGGCPELDRAIRLVVVPDTRETVDSRLCTDDWARISVPGGMQHSVCRAQVRDKLTAQEVAALPAAHRP